jgi:hypothetical protein
VRSRSCSTPRPALVQPRGRRTDRDRRDLIEAAYAANGLLWSSPLYQGTISGAFKNALDWLHTLGAREPGQVRDETVERQLKMLGHEVVRVAERFAADASLHRHAECAQAAERVAAVA